MLSREVIVQALILQAAILLVPPIIYILYTKNPRLIGITRENMLSCIILGLAAGIPLALLSISLDKVGFRNQIAVELSKKLGLMDIFFLNIFVVAPSEELLFRGFLQPKIGLFPASLLFGLVHWFGYFNVPQVIGATFLGLILGLLFEWKKNIVTPIVAHATTNIFSMVFIRTF
ncbi:MAG: lysostaphin resistance A-like protein [Candidatus Hydrothermarchaeota archaeon]